MLWRGLLRFMSGLCLGLVAPVAGLSEAYAITLSRQDNKITVSGPIETGDGAKFAAWLKGEIDAAKVASRAQGKEEWESATDTWFVTFDSPGGSLADGMAIGRAIHDSWLETHLERGKGCYSACAIAFLGGVRQYATGLGPWREVQAGAKLGFHGYRAAAQQVVVLNEAFDQARVLNGLVLEYALQMKEIDLGYISELMTVASDDIKIVNTPEGLKKLGIQVSQGLPPRPAKAGYNICHAAVSKTVPSMDGFDMDERLDGKTRQVIPTMAAFRSALINDRFPQVETEMAPLRSMFAKLPVEPAIDLMAGQPLYLGVSQNVSVERFLTARGSGFYYDQCYAVLMGDSAVSLLMAPGQAKYLSHGPLDVFPPGQPLWTY